MELTAKNVQDVVKDCLFDVVPKDPKAALLVNGVVSGFGFDPLKVQKHKEDIESMLTQLPDDFLEAGGGGMSFLNACVRKDGVQWGEHRSIDELVCLGMAVGKVDWCMPREVWSALPGGLPYFVIKTEASLPKEQQIRESR